MAESLLRIVKKQEMFSYDSPSLVPANWMEENEIKSFIEETFPIVEITQVYKVENKYLRGMYLLKKEEYESRSMERYGSKVFAKEKRLIHATAAHNVSSIISDNLDWRRVSRNKFGKGISFSPDADYANFHSNSANGTHRAFIVADVLIGSECGGNAFMSIPEFPFDTSKGNNEKVYVKYYDNEFYPSHVVFYDAPSRQSSKYFHHRYRSNRLRKFM